MEVLLLFSSPVPHSLRRCTSTLCTHSSPPPCVCPSASCCRSETRRTPSCSATDTCRSATWYDTTLACYISSVPSHSCARNAGASFVFHKQTEGETGAWSTSKSTSPYDFKKKSIVLNEWTISYILAHNLAFRKVTGLGLGRSFERTI